MNCKRRQNGLTMIEILVAVAILAILAAGLFFVSSKTRLQANKQLVQSTLTLLDTALQQYYDFTHDPNLYPPDVNYATGEAGSPPYTRSIQAALVASSTPVNIPAGGGYVIDYSEAQSVEVLYYYLDRVPQSRQVLSKLDDAVISGKAVKLDVYGKPLPSKISDPNVVITINGQTVGLMRIIDPWNMSLQYIRYRDPTKLTKENFNFPLIRSAGPDKVFGTDDDIVNKKN